MGIVGMYEDTRLRVRVRTRGDVSPGVGYTKVQTGRPASLGVPYFDCVSKD